MAGDPDAIVIGSGPNGLVAACMLARAGLRVLVCEANPRRWGGALGSEEATLPGFIHDVGAAFFPFPRLSPAFRALDLERHGAALCFAEFESCHPAPDGSVACISRDLEVCAQHFGDPRDGAAFAALASWYRRVEPSVLGILLGALPSIKPVFGLLPFSIFRLARILLSSGAGLAQRLFHGEAARRVMPGLALHVDVGPRDPLGAALGFMLAMTATTGGYAIPRGGAQSLADAMVADLRRHGGEIRLGCQVTQVLTEGRRAVGVRLGDGTEIRAARHAVLADTGAASLLLDLVARDLVPARVVRFMERFPQGWGTFKVDWALASPVPWTVPEARRSAVVHAGDSLADLERFTAQVRRGELPDNPYLVIGQQSLADPSRAPAGKQTLWAYSRVPSHPAGGWHSHAEAFADRIEARIEGLAPGFRSTVLARRLVAPPDLEASNANLVGGDLGGGSNAWHRQLVLRPIFPYFRHRMPIRGLYLCSSYAHPGAGVHGMCGYNAAQIALRDIA